MVMKTKPTMSDIRSKIDELDQMIKESGLEGSALINVKNDKGLDQILFINVDLKQGSKPSISWMQNVISIGCMMHAIELCKAPTLTEAKQAINWFYDLKNQYQTKK